MDGGIRSLVYAIADPRDAVAIPFILLIGLLVSRLPPANLAYRYRSHKLASRILGGFALGLLPGCIEKGTIQAFATFRLGEYPATVYTLVMLIAVAAIGSVVVERVLHHALNLQRQ
jgi:hypothetical protein